MPRRRNLLIKPDRLKKVVMLASGDVNRSLPVRTIQRFLLGRNFTVSNSISRQLTVKFILTCPVRPLAILHESDAEEEEEKGFAEPNDDSTHNSS